MARNPLLPTASRRASRARVARAISRARVTSAGVVGARCYTVGMQPITVQIPDGHADAIAAEVQHDGPGTDRAAVVRVWIGPALELVLSPAAADRLADALVDALAAEDDDNPVILPAIVVGW